MGSSVVEKASARIAKRRIDLLVDARGHLPALAHELTHLILVDRFAGVAPPLWFDEGAAMLVDPDEKQALHQRDCRIALADGRALPLRTLLQLERFAAPEQMAAFYGQSASLMRFLGGRGDIDKIARFGLDGLTVGYDQALRRHYQIENVAELERQWKQFAVQHDQASFDLATLAVDDRSLFQDTALPRSRVAPPISTAGQVVD